MKKTKCLALFSGGLDSCLVIKLLQDQGLDVEALYIKLPFNCDCFDFDNFLKKEKIKLHVLDATKGKLFKDYMEIIRDPKFNRGSGFNPCKDCKIFLFKQAKKFAKKINAEIIATGEVLGQRPMSQMKKDLFLNEKESKLENKILRPLCAKLLAQTIYEKEGLVKRENFLDIFGRTRTRQIALAKRYKIRFQHPAGGCLLCEKLLKKRFEVLFEKGFFNEETIRLSNVGRHFILDKFWVVLGRDEKENKILENMKKGKLVEPDYLGPSVRVFGDINKISRLQKQESLRPKRIEFPTPTRDKMNKLIKAYSKKGSLKQREKFEKFKI